MKVATIKTFIIVVVFTIMAFHASAQNISISEIELAHISGTHSLNAQVDYDFSDEAIEALHHGVDIYIVHEALIKQQRQFLWDKIKKRSTLTYKLEYHPLSERYVLTNLDQFNRTDFQYLNTALETMGNIQGWKIVHSAELNPQHEYKVMVQAKLDIVSLPAPLRLLAFVSGNWQIHSDWYQWQLTK